MLHFTCQSWYLNHLWNTQQGLKHQSLAKKTGLGFQIHGMQSVQLKENIMWLHQRHKGISKLLEAFNVFEKKFRGRCLQCVHKLGSNINAFCSSHWEIQTMFNPDRCQRSSTEEGIHPTPQVSESWHVNTAEETCYRGWERPGPAGCWGVTTRPDCIILSGGKLSLLTHNIHPDDNGQELHWSEGVFPCDRGFIRLSRMD